MTIPIEVHQARFDRSRAALNGVVELFRLLPDDPDVEHAATRLRMLKDRLNHALLTAKMYEGKDA